MKNLSECTVLVVDDTEVNIDLLMECLGDTYELAVAMDGETALEAVAEERPDLILLDVMMPGMDGYEVCRRLKADETTHDIPIVFVTAMGEVSDETQGLDLGAVDYITKPFSPPIVKARVRNHLELKLAREDLQEQHSRLQESYEKLRELEELRDNLTHMIVHDMRSPLMGIHGGIEMVLMDAGDDLDEETTEDLNMALEANQRLIEMVSSLLDVSKLESGEMKLDLGNRDLRPIAEEAVTSLGVLTRKCSVAVEECESEVLAYCDSEITRRIIANLVGNAIKFTPEGGEVRIGLVAGDGSTRVEVRDTGPGIPPEYHGRIFEKFGQVQGRKEGKRFSTGLGLTFCKLATEAHGGEIGIESELGKGSTFWFALPVQAE